MEQLNLWLGLQQTFNLSTAASMDVFITQQRPIISRQGTAKQCVITGKISLIRNTEILFIMLNWHSTIRDNILGLQKKAIRMIKGTANREPCRKHFRELKILTLKS
jgi:hypothetical protein